MNLTQLELNQPEEIILKLTDPARPFKDLGEIKIVATLMPKTQEDKEQVCYAGCQWCTRINFKYWFEEEKACLACEKVFLSLQFFSVEFLT